jgi:hypothetical protein
MSLAHSNAVLDTLFTADFVRSQEKATKLIDHGCAITDQPRAHAM